MKQYVAAALALIAGILMAYFGLGTFIDRFFKGRIIDIILVIILIIILMSLIIAVVGIGLRISDYFFDIFPE